MRDDAEPNEIDQSRSKLPADGSGNNFELTLIRPGQNRQDAPCSASCPAGGSIREWIGLVAQRNKLGRTPAEAYRQAWELLVARNPLPATMGRICPHPCESSCNRIEKDDAVAVNQMERFLGDWAISEQLALPRLSRTIREKSVGVIGAGPAGLSFAYQMSRRGYEVTVYDRHEMAGGMLRYGIPDYRLPPDVLDAEIKRIADLGVRMVLGVEVGENPTLEAIGRKYDVIFVGIGAQRSRRLDIPGENGSDVLTGSDFLYRINSGEEVPLGAHVVVVGGGNTAIDAARSARRRGAAVTILYRRSRREIPAHDQEIQDAMEEGVSFEFLVAPTEIRRIRDRVSSVVVQRMRLGNPDASGRKKPVPIPDSEFELSAQTIITAVSQSVDWNRLETLQREEDVLVYAPDPDHSAMVLSGGDVGGPGIASLAIGQGRAAAEAAHARIQRVVTDAPVAAPISRSPKLPLYEEHARVVITRLRPSARLQAIDAQTSPTISEEQFVKEAERCLSCGSCFGCRHCWMYCNAVAFVEADKQSPGKYYLLDLSVCEGCGKCIEVCPTGFLTSEPPARS